MKYSLWLVSIGKIRPLLSNPFRKDFTQISLKIYCNGKHKFHNFLQMLSVLLNSNGIFLHRLYKVLKQALSESWKSCPLLQSPRLRNNGAFSPRLLWRANQQTYNTLNALKFKKCDANIIFLLYNLLCIMLIPWGQRLYLSTLCMPSTSEDIRGVERNKFYLNQSVAFSYSSLDFVMENESLSCLK